MITVRSKKLNILFIFSPNVNCIQYCTTQDENISNRKTFLTQKIMGITNVKNILKMFKSAISLLKVDISRFSHSSKWLSI